MTADEKVNILMVDDQPAKLMSYEVILDELGENLIKATSAAAALNVLLKTDVAVVLMDVSMPDVDGFELADVIRQHPRFQKTAIIFISGVHLTDSDRIQGYRSGAVDYISVPVIPEVLRAKISVFVELHRKTRMLEALNRDLELRVAERTAELRKSEAQFRIRAELIEVASEAIIIRDAAGRIQFWNSGAENLWLAARGGDWPTHSHPLANGLSCSFWRSRTSPPRETVVARQFDSNDQGWNGDCGGLPQEHEPGGRRGARGWPRHHRPAASGTNAARDGEAGGDGPRGRHHRP